MPCIRPFAPTRRGASFLLTAATAAVLGFAGAGSARAQSVAATVSVGSLPGAIAVNSTTNKIYVANTNATYVTVIDGVTFETTTVPAPSPFALAVNEVTDTIYVANQQSNVVTVVHGADNSTVTVPVGTQPGAVAVNPSTNLIYVANGGSNTVTVIDGANNGTTTVPTGGDPIALAVNATTDRIYVANQDGTVTVINGVNNSTATVKAGSGPTAIAVNPVTDKVYVVNVGSNTVTVIDGATNNTVTLPTGPKPQAVAIDTRLNQVYVPNLGIYGQPTSPLTIIDGATNAVTTVNVDNGSDLVAVDPATDHVFVAVSNLFELVTLSGTSDSVLGSVGVGNYPAALAVNPVTGTIFSANFFDNTVTVIDDAKPSGPASQSITFNAIANQKQGTTLTLAATASSGLPVSFSSSTGDVCTVSGTTASLSGKGTCTITASQAGNASFQPAPSVTRSFQVTAPLKAPTAVSVSPNSGSGTSQAFTAVFADANGTQDLQTLSLLFNVGTGAAHACLVEYLPGKNLLYLEDDAGTALLKGIKLGSNATLSNSQCTVLAASSSYATQSDQATLTVSLKFTGSKTVNIYLDAADTNGTSSGWVQEGNWKP